MYPIGKDKTSLRAREINTGDASKSLFRINRSTQGNPIQNIGMPSRKISIENKHTGILKRSAVVSTSKEKKLDIYRSQTPQKHRSTSKNSGNDNSLLDKSRHRRKQVSFQLTETMLNKFKDRPPTGDTADSSKSRLGAKIEPQVPFIAKPSPNRDLLAESKKAGFFTKIKVSRKPQPQSLAYYTSELLSALRTNKPTKTDKQFRDQLIEHFQVKEYFRDMKPITVDQIIAKKKFFSKLDRDKSKPFTLVLDLDETLIHTVDNDQSFDVELDIEDSHTLMQIRYNVRPHLHQFLKRVSQNYEIIVFTASEEGYADPIIDSIDPEGAYISHRFYRHHCIEVDHNLYIKDLRVLGQRPQDKTCIVDNAIHSYFMNLRNGIPVIPFMQDRNDDQLPKLADFLMAVDCQNDIRTVIDKHFNYDAFMSVEDPKAFLGQIEQPRYS